MDLTTDDLIAELNSLLRLTAVEATVARARRLQARDDSVDAELVGNAQEADRRARRIAEALRELGVLPDALGATLARAAATVRIAVVDQLLPLDEALLADLALEHQLLDRARFARALAEVSGATDVVALCEDLVASHTETVEWLRTRLGEVALGGPPALLPTPTQVLARGVLGATMVPARWLVGGVNRVAASSAAVRRSAGDQLGRLGERGEDVVESLSTGVGAARTTFLRVVEREASDRDADDVAEVVHRVRAAGGALEARELPVTRYDELNAAAAAGAIEDLDDAEDVRTVLAYEQQHKGRRVVVRAAERRIERLAAELTG